MDERYPEVNKMAAIVLAKPAATAREIARDLRYSQPRSVYYWLRKAGFSGLTPFRHAVLTGEYPVATTPEGAFKPRAARVAEVPLSVGPRETTAGGRDEQYVVTTRAVSEGAFALKVTSEEYVPLFQPDDIVIIDPAASVQQGDLVAVRDEEADAEEMLCRAYPGRRPLYIHPASGRPLTGREDQPSTYQLIGKIVGMQRHF